MSDARQRPTTSGFLKTFVLPSLVVFLLPALSLAFFRHAQHSYDEEARIGLLQQIRDDESLTPEDRANALAFFEEHPFSELITNNEFARDVDPSVLRDYAMFRWLIRLSAWSIAAGAAVFLLGGVCVLLSLRSQQAQYWSLSAGWQLLRIYGAVQTAVLGVLVLALSYWVTALWFHVFVPKLILIAGLLALVAVAAVIKAIFTRPVEENIVEGVVIRREDAVALWEELNAICERVGTAPPDQIIAGIDDNFYVTEVPLKVDGQVFTGRSLYVSLSLLKHMRGAEADAVLAHEMAHFSGNDTVYSRKISPLLMRYSIYLQALYSNAVTKPVYYFMNCFRALYELSLKRHSRSREFRADRIASEVTSPRDFASGLLRVGAYSAFRNNIQQELFQAEHTLDAANILERIEYGFHAFASKYASNPEIGNVETAHPFDSHPPLRQRLEAIGVPLSLQDARALLDAPVAGRWYQKINRAEELELQQWRAFEERFRAFHEESLAYRYLPESDAELALVAKYFPPLEIAGKKGVMTLDHASIHYTSWPTPVRFDEIKHIAADDQGVLRIQVVREQKLKFNLKLTDFGSRQQEAAAAINGYYGRFLNAKAYREQRQSDGQGLRQEPAPV